MLKFLPLQLGFATAVAVIFIVAGLPLTLFASAVYPVNFTDQRIDGLAANTVYFKMCNVVTGATAALDSPNGAGNQSNWLFSERIPASSYTGLTVRLYFSTSPDSSVSTLDCSDPDPIEAYNYAYPIIKSDGTKWVPASPDFSGTGSRIIDVVPQYDDYVASTTVGFQVDLFNDVDNYFESVRIDLVNMDTGVKPFGGLGFFYIPTVGFGQQTVYATTTLSPGYYFGSAVLDVGVGVYDQLSFPVGFTVLQSSYDNINFPAIEGAIASTTPTCNDSNFFQNALCAVFLPSPASLNNFSLLASTTKTKIPFAYFFQTRDILLSQSSSASTSLGTVTIPIGASTSPFLPTTVVMFSQETLREFVPDSVSSSVRVVTTAGLWVEFLWYVWHRSRRLIAHAHSATQ